MDSHTSRFRGTADDLFATVPLREVRRIAATAFQDASGKAFELRELVAGRYTDLIETADEATTMLQGVQDIVKTVEELQTNAGRFFRAKPWDGDGQAEAQDAAASTATDSPSLLAFAFAADNREWLASWLAKAEEGVERWVSLGNPLQGSFLALSALAASSSSSSSSSLGGSASGTSEENRKSFQPLIASLHASAVSVLQTFTSSSSSSYQRTTTRTTKGDEDEDDDGHESNNEEGKEGNEDDEEGEALSAASVQERVSSAAKALAALVVLEALSSSTTATAANPKRLAASARTVFASRVLVPATRSLKALLQPSSPSSRQQQTATTATLRSRMKRACSLVCEVAMLSSLLWGDSGSRWTAIASLLASACSFAASASASASAAVSAAAAAQRSEQRELLSSLLSVPRWLENLVAQHQQLTTTASASASSASASSASAPLPPSLDFLYSRLSRYLVLPSPRCCREAYNDDSNDGNGNDDSTTVAATSALLPCAASLAARSVLCRRHSRSSAQPGASASLSSYSSTSSPLVSFASSLASADACSLVASLCLRDAGSWLRQAIESGLHRQVPSLVSGNGHARRHHHAAATNNEGYNNDDDEEEEQSEETGSDDDTSGFVAELKAFCEECYDDDNNDSSNDNGSSNSSKAFQRLSLLPGGFPAAYRSLTTTSTTTAAASSSTTYSLLFASPLATATVLAETALLKRRLETLASLFTGPFLASCAALGSAAAVAASTQAEQPSFFSDAANDKDGEAKDTEDTVTSPAQAWSFLQREMGRYHASKEAGPSVASAVGALLTLAQNELLPALLFSSSSFSNSTDAAKREHRRRRRHQQNQQQRHLSAGAGLLAAKLTDSIAFLSLSPCHSPPVAVLASLFALCFEAVVAVHSSRVAEACPPSSSSSSSAAVTNSLAKDAQREALQHISSVTLPAVAKQGRLYIDCARAVAGVVGTDDGSSLLFTLDRVCAAASYALAGFFSFSHALLSGSGGGNAVSPSPFALLGPSATSNSGVGGGGGSSAFSSPAASPLKQQRGGFGAGSGSSSSSLAAQLTALEQASFEAAALSARLLATVGLLPLARGWKKEISHAFGLSSVSSATTTVASLQVAANRFRSSTGGWVSIAIGTDKDALSLWMPTCLSPPLARSAAAFAAHLVLLFGKDEQGSNSDSNSGTADSGSNDQSDPWGERLASKILLSNTKPAASSATTTTASSGSTTVSLGVSALRSLVSSEFSAGVGVCYHAAAVAVRAASAVAAANNNAAPSSSALSPAMAVSRALQRLLLSSSSSKSSKTADGSSIGGGGSVVAFGPLLKEMMPVALAAATTAAGNSENGKGTKGQAAASGGRGDNDGLDSFAADDTEEADRLTSTADAGNADGGDAAEEDADEDSGSPAVVAVPEAFSLQLLLDCLVWGHVMGPVAVVLPTRLQQQQQQQQQPQPQPMGAGNEGHDQHSYHGQELSFWKRLLFSAASTPLNSSSSGSGGSSSSSSSAVEALLGKHPLCLHHAVSALVAARRQQQQEQQQAQQPLLSSQDGLVTCAGVFSFVVSRLLDPVEWSLSEPYLKASAVDALLSKSSLLLASVAPQIPFYHQPHNKEDAQRQPLAHLPALVLRPPSSFLWTPVSASSSPSTAASAAAAAAAAGVQQPNWSILSLMTKQRGLGAYLDPPPSTSSSSSVLVARQLDAAAAGLGLPPLSAAHQASINACHSALSSLQSQGKLTPRAALLLTPLPNPFAAADLDLEPMTVAPALPLLPPAAVSSNAAAAAAAAAAAGAAGAAGAGALSTGVPRVALLPIPLKPLPALTNSNSSGMNTGATDPALLLRVAARQFAPQGDKLTREKTTTATMTAASTSTSTSAVVSASESLVVAAQGLRSIQLFLSALAAHAITLTTMASAATSAAASGPVASPLPQHRRGSSSMTGGRKHKHHHHPRPLAPFASPIKGGGNAAAATTNGAPATAVKSAAGSAKAAMMATPVANSANGSRRRFAGVSSPLPLPALAFGGPGALGSAGSPIAVSSAAGQALLNSPVLRYAAPEGGSGAGSNNNNADADADDGSEDSDGQQRPAAASSSKDAAAKRRKEKKEKERQAWEKAAVSSPLSALLSSSSSSSSRVGVVSGSGAAAVTVTVTTAQPQAHRGRGVAGGAAAAPTAPNAAAPGWFSSPPQGGGAGGAQQVKATVTNVGATVAAAATSSLAGLSSRLFAFAGGSSGGGAAGGGASASGGAGGGGLGGWQYQ